MILSFGEEVKALRKKLTVAGVGGACGIGFICAWILWPFIADRIILYRLNTIDNPDEERLAFAAISKEYIETLSFQDSSGKIIPWQSVHNYWHSSQVIDVYMVWWPRSRWSYYRVRHRVIENTNVLVLMGFSYDEYFKRVKTSESGSQGS